MKKTHLKLALLLLVAGLVIWLVSGPRSEMNREDNSMVFVSSETQEEVLVTFSEEVATVSFREFSEITLQATESASGARYENTELGLVVWNQGEELSIYQNDEVVYVGQTLESLGVPNLDNMDSKSAQLSNNAWVWRETIMNDDTIITPNQFGDFVLTFDTLGRVNGTSDCNNFGGEYTVENELIAMGPFMMTKMFCEGSKEMEFQKMLADPLGFMFTDAGELVLMLPYDSGSIIFEPEV